jgi:hypothetical protein
LDQKTKGGRVHEVPRWWLSAGWCQARFTAVLAQRRQPRRPGCRQRECMADAPGASIGPWSKLRKSPSDTAGQPEMLPCRSARLTAPTSLALDGERTGLFERPSAK